MSKEDIIKKIAMGVLIPVFLMILGWGTWVTKQAFSAQQTQTILQEHKIESDRNRIIIQEELDSIEDTVQESFKGLHEKIDKNTQDNNKILLDLQKQIGEINK